MKTTIKINEKINLVITLPTIDKKDIENFFKVEQITDYLIEKN